MGEYTVELEKLDNQHSLVLWVMKSGRKEFVVCSNYTEERPIGSRWDWGHYFTSLVNAVDYFKEVSHE